MTQYDKSENKRHIQPPAKGMAGYEDNANRLFRTAPLTVEDCTTKSMRVERRGMEITVKVPPKQEFDRSQSQLLETKKRTKLNPVIHNRTVFGCSTTYDDAFEPRKTYPKTAYAHTRRNESHIKFDMGICEGYKNDVWESQTSRTHNHVPERFFIGFANGEIAKEYKHMTQGKEYSGKLYRTYGE